MGRAQRLIRGFRQRYNLTTKDSVRDLKKYNPRANSMSNDDLLISNRGGYAKSFRMVIDNIIETYSSRFSKDDYLYRISRAKKTAYSAPSDNLDTNLRKITTGDIIMDQAMWSSTTKGEVAIFRYSSKEESASQSRIIDISEEEILFIIQNNKYLKSIDISGFKFPKEKEGKTSGEMLIKSQSKFKVIGIQKSNPMVDRKIIILEPINEDSLKPTDLIKDPFTGEICSTTTTIYTRTPSASAASTATASVDDSELGAVGGATGTTFPDLP